MSKEVITAMLQGSTVVHRGKVISIELDGTILVTTGADSQKTFPCQVLRTSAVTPSVEPGDSVIYLVPEEDATTGYILGVIDMGELLSRELPRTEAHKHRTAAQKKPPARLVLEGEKEVILRTGRATIVLRSSGDVEIRGRRIVSRAANLQKLSAPMLKLN